MTERWRRMLSSDDEDESPEKCRERRRRRIEMRRLTTTSTPGSSQPPPPQNQKAAPPSTPSKNGTVKRLNTGEAPEVSSNRASYSTGDDVGETIVVESPASEEAPVFGTMSVAGRLREMEDALAVRTSLCRPAINRLMPVHFFAVYDGHGGAHVAALCRDSMHEFVEQELMRVQLTHGNASVVGRSTNSQSVTAEEGWKEGWRKALGRSFARMDDVALNTCACGSVGFSCGCDPIGVAFAGSTAVVVLLTQEHIVVANCGDSRAVLCRGRRAVPLTADHKPDRPDERARVEAAGGRVIYSRGPRVEGILAMSRAIGDKYLKRYVVSEPEITYTKRSTEDECLILATDGLWGVLSTDVACKVALQCLREGNRFAAVNGEPQIEDEEVGALYPSRSVLAAAILTRLSLGRGSFDNISVIVIDLKKS